MVKKGLKNREYLKNEKVSILFWKKKKKKNIYIYLSGFGKSYLQKFQVRFNNLTLEVNKKQLKVAS